MSSKAEAILVTASDMVVAAWAIVTRVMKLDFVLDLNGALAAAAGAVIFAVLIGLAGTWRILGQKPASYLRQT